MHKKLIMVALTMLLSWAGSSLCAQTTNGLQLWLKPEGLPTLVPSAPIVLWTDSSPGGFHATNNTGTKQPTYSPNALNGYPVAHFTGDGLISANLNWLQSPLPFNSAYTNFTAIIVYRANIPAVANPRLQLIHQVGGFANLYIPVTSSTTNIKSDAGNFATAGAPITTGTWKIATVVEDATSVKIYENGVLLETKGIGAVVANSGGGWVLGARQDKTRFGFNGDIAEVLVYDTSLDQFARSSTESYLATKYGLSYPVVLADDFSNPQTGSAAPQGYTTGGGPVNIGSGSISMNNSTPLGGYEFFYATCNLNVLPYETAAQLQISFDINNLNGSYLLNQNDSWAAFTLSQYYPSPGGPVTDWGFLIRTNGTGVIFEHPGGGSGLNFIGISVPPSTNYHVDLIITNGMVRLLINGADQGTSTILCPLTFSQSFMGFGIGTDNNGAVAADFKNLLVTQTKSESSLPTLPGSLQLLDNFNTADSGDLNANLARQSGPVAPVSWSTNGNLNSVVSISDNGLLLTNSPGGGVAVGMASPTGDFRQYEHLNSFRISYTVQGTNDSISNDSWIGTRFRDNAPSHFVADADGGGTGMNFFSGDGRWYLWQSFLGETNTSAIVGSGSVPVAASYAFEFEVRTNLLRIKINGQPLLIGCGALADAYLLSTAQVNNFITLHCFAGGAATSAFAKFDDFKFESLDTGLTVAAPTILNPAVAGSNFSFNLNTVSPIFYAVDSKTDIAAPAWTYLGGFVGNGGSVSYTNTTATNSAQFYRVRVP